MSETVTLELPATLAQHARTIAAQTQRPVEAVLLEWLDRGAVAVPMETLPDEQVLAIRDQVMSAAEQTELSDLLERQREGQLSSTEQEHLHTLMASYRRGMVQKARALQVAVERGLQPPLH